MSSGDLALQLPLVPLLQRSRAQLLAAVSPGIHGLALAVLEEGIRDYVYGVGPVRTEVEAWFETRAGASPFAFDALCETLGLAPNAVRTSVHMLRAQRSDTDRRRRARPNSGGRVHRS